MRPGQEAPDGFYNERGRYMTLEASMRPGQEAPDGHATPRPTKAPMTLQ